MMNNGKARGPALDIRGKPGELTGITYAWAYGMVDINVGEKWRCSASAPTSRLDGAIVTVEGIETDFEFGPAGKFASKYNTRTLAALKEAYPNGREAGYLVSFAVDATGDRYQMYAGVFASDFVRLSRQENECP